MGGIANVAKKVVGWIGDCIETVVSWWKPHKEKVNKITYNYIMVNQQFICQSHDPKNVGEIMAIKKEKVQLEDISAKNYRNLSYGDRQRLDELLDQRDYY